MAANIKDRAILELANAEQIAIINNAIKALDRDLKIAQVYPEKLGLKPEIFNGTYAVIYRRVKPGTRFLKYLMRFTKITKV